MKNKSRKRWISARSLREQTLQLRDEVPEAIAAIAYGNQEQVDELMEFCQKLAKFLDTQPLYSRSHHNVACRVSDMIVTVQNILSLSGQLFDPTDSSKLTINDK